VTRRPIKHGPGIPETPRRRRPRSPSAGSWSPGNKIVPDTTKQKKKPSSGGREVETGETAASRSRSCLREQLAGGTRRLARLDGEKAVGRGRSCHLNDAHTDCCCCCSRRVTMGDTPPPFVCPDLLETFEWAGARQHFPAHNEWRRRESEVTGGDRREVLMQRSTILKQPANARAFWVVALSLAWLAGGGGAVTTWDQGDRRLSRTGLESDARI
jgi:hypothetical protein